MKKNYKRLIGYAIIMVVCVLMIVLIAAISEERVDDFQEMYEQSVTAGQKQIDSLEKQIDELADENKRLKKEIEKGQSLGSDLVTAWQAMSDLRDIYEMYKSGNSAEAKKQLDKIEPMGFDDATLSYYEVLCDLIK